MDELATLEDRVELARSELRRKIHMLNEYTRAVQTLEPAVKQLEEELESRG